MLPASTLAHLEWSRVCEELLRRVVSPAAQDRFRDDDGLPAPERLAPRTLDPGIVMRRLEALGGLEFALRLAMDLGEGRVSLAGELVEIVDTERLLERAQRGSALDVGELAAVSLAVVAASRLAVMFERVATERLERVSVEERAGFAALQDTLRGLAPRASVAAELERSIERENGEFRLSDRASEALGRLRAEAGGARRSLISAAERLLRRQGMEKALADRYWTEREGRVVLPVRSDAFSRAGRTGTVSGIIHGSSSSGQTLFVEPPELVELANARREAQMAVFVEEQRILAKLSAMVGESGPELLQSLSALVELDRLHACLRLSRDLDACAPIVTVPKPGARISLRAARHPLMVLRGTEVVPNDIALDVGQALVVSGPNAGGKTVALKTLGLCALMAQAALPLPTDGPAELPLFGGLITDVGDDQSISANLSTFSAHIGHVMDALTAAEVDAPAVLCLLDEVAVGTDPDQGAALAEAILTTLVARGATLVVTTHYERLKLLATEDPARFINAAVGFDLEQLRPTFRLRMGAPGSSSALAVARRLGVPEDVLSRAETLLADSRLRVDALLQQVEAERERLHEENLALQRAWRQVRAEQAALADKDARAETRAAVRHQRAHDAAAAALRELEDEIKDRRKSLRKETIAAAEGVSDPQARDFARAVRSQIASHAPKTQESTGAPVVALELGQKVRVARLGSEGSIVAIKGDKVTVQLPLAKVTVERGDLEAPGSSSRAAQKPAAAARPEAWAADDVSRFFGANASPVQAKIDNVVDLRGVRAEEALTLVEVGLDRALGDDVDVVILKHGHGSGALRKVVREHLPRLSHVHRYRPGLPAEGGDAVTVVWVRT